MTEEGDWEYHVGKARGWLFRMLVGVEVGLSWFSLEKGGQATYHYETNIQHFMEWFKESLIPIVDQIQYLYWTLLPITMQV